jgi:hypothetical protein
MLNVVNKGKIESMINEFYTSFGLADYHNPLLISQLSVVGGCPVGIGGGCYEDDFEDEDYAFDYELGMFFDNNLSDTFCIKPSTAFVSEDAGSMSLEWIMQKPVFVTSKNDLIKLYESFVHYLETAHYSCKSWHGYSPLNADVSLRFADLHSYSVTIEPELVNQQNVNVLFTAEHFKPEYTVIRTLNGVFRYLELPR